MKCVTFLFVCVRARIFSRCFDVVLLSSLDLNHTQWSIQFGPIIAASNRPFIDLYGERTQKKEKKKQS